MNVGALQQVVDGWFNVYCVVRCQSWSAAAARDSDQFCARVVARDALSIGAPHIARAYDGDADALLVQTDWRTLPEWAQSRRFATVARCCRPLAWLSRRRAATIVA